MVRKLIERAIVGWSFVSAFSITYHLLMVMVGVYVDGQKRWLTTQEASICRVYVLLGPQNALSRQIALESEALRGVSIKHRKVSLNLTE